MRRAQTEDSGRRQGNVQSEQEQERDRCGHFTGDGGGGRRGEATSYGTLVIIKSLY